MTCRSRGCRCPALARDVFCASHKTVLDRVEKLSAGRLTMAQS